MSEVVVKRHVLKQTELTKRSSFIARPRCVPDCCLANYCSWRRLRHFFLRLFPCLEMFEEYNCKRDIYPDILTGLTIGFIQIPQSLAYASLANVAPVCGLYTAFISSIIYFIFGTSRQANSGTFAIVCLLAGDIIVTSENDDTNDDAQLMAAICIVVGLYQFIFFILQLGKLCQWLSETLINAFSVACSFHIMSSQIADILGFRLSPRSGYFRIIKVFIDVGKNIKRFNYVTFLFALSCLTVLFANNFGLKPYLNKKCRFQVPIELIMMLLGILCSYLLDLEQKYGVLLVGQIPTGFAGPIFTTFEYMKIVALQSIAIAVVSFIMSASISLYFSKKGRYEIRPNQDAFAFAVMNIVGSFFYCVPTSVSLVRTMICFNMNSVSQLVGIFSCIIISVVILWGGYIVRLLPRCVIASIITSAVVRTLKEFKLLKFYWKISKIDFAIWIITFLCVSFIDITIGLGVGIGISILAICYQSFRTDSCLLGGVPNTEIYLDLRKFKQAQEIPGIKIFRYAGGINFATRQLFRNGLSRAIGVSAKQILIERTKAQRNLKSGENVPELSFDFKIIVLDFSGITNIDYQGIESFKTVVEDYKQIGIEMLMASPHGDVYETFLHIINVCNYDDKYPFFPTIHDAVIYSITFLKNKESSTS